MTSRLGTSIILECTSFRVHESSFRLLLLRLCCNRCAEALVVKITTNLHHPSAWCCHHPCTVLSPPPVLLQLCVVPGLIVMARLCIQGVVDCQGKHTCSSLVIIPVQRAHKIMIYFNIHILADQIIIPKIRILFTVMDTAA